MSIWIVHQTLAPEQEDTIQERNYVILPLEGMPDLSHVKSSQAYMSMLRDMHPDAPPETISGLMSQTWKIFHDVHKEDILAVPLPTRQEVALAEVTGHYEYRRENGIYTHLLPVKWHEKRISFRAFKKFPTLLQFNPRRQAYEIDNQQARIIVRERLPHSYNRFVGLKWLLILFFAWRLIMHVMHLGSSLDTDVLP